MGNGRGNVVMATGVSSYGLHVFRVPAVRRGSAGRFSSGTGGDKEGKAVMPSRVNGTRLRRRYTARLERVRQEWLTDEGIPEGYRDGFCAGLQFAQTLIRKG
jgi:hypothetical protein